MSVTGDFGKLKKWEEFFESIAADEFRREIVGDMALESVNLIDKGFTNEKDPFGNPWEPKKNPDGMKTLEGKTKDLRHSFKIKATTHEGFTIRNNVKYFPYHQRGAVRRGSNWKLPKRQMMPKTGEGLPTPYTTIYKAVCRSKWLMRLNKI
jgi:hypothetical protein